MQVNPEASELPPPPPPPPKCTVVATVPLSGIDKFGVGQQNTRRASPGLPQPKLSAVPNCWSQSWGPWGTMTLVCVAGSAQTDKEVHCGHQFWHKG